MQRCSPLLFVLVGWFACRSTSADYLSHPFAFSAKRFHYKSCIRDSVCATMTFAYPVFSGGNPAATDLLNQAVETNLRSFAFWANVPNIGFETALDTAAHRMEKALRATVAEDVRYATPWVNKVDGRIVFQNKRYLSLSLDNYSFMGGKHPNTFVHLATYDLNTGRSIPVVDMISDTTAVLRLLEQVFRSTKDIGPEENLKNYLLVDRLPLPDNACIVSEGVRFHYNPYEIASHAFGPIDLLLPWEQLIQLSEKQRWLE
jgi:Deacetylase PdaC/Protein of unknown function (DUF3298)